MFEQGHVGPPSGLGFFALLVHPLPPVVSSGRRMNMATSWTLSLLICAMRWAMVDSFFRNSKRSVRRGFMLQVHVRTTMRTTTTTTTATTYGAKGAARTRTPPHLAVPIPALGGGEHRGPRLVAGDVAVDHSVLIVLEPPTEVLGGRDAAGAAVVVPKRRRERPC